MIVTSVQIKTAKIQKHLYCPVFTERLHKIDATTENPDKIGVFAVFTVKKHKGRMTDENHLFCLFREK